MNDVNFILNKPKREKSPIDVVVYAFKQKYKFSSGESIIVDHWNKKKKRSKEGKDYEGCYRLNQRLKVIEGAVNDCIQEFHLLKIVPTNEQLKIAVKAHSGPIEVKTVYTVTEYIDHFIKSVTRANLTLKRYGTSRNKLLEYEKTVKRKIMFEDITMSFYNSFQKHLYDKDYSVNYFGDIIKNLIMFHKAAKSEGLHRHELPEKFKVISEDSDSIYLTTSELKLIADLEINHDLILDGIEKKIIDLKIFNVVGNWERMITALIDCRDRFLIGAYTAMRYSDYVYLKGLKSTDEYITRVSQKTGIKTVIPMHSVIRDILVRRNNQLPPPISNQKMNKQLKVLCQLSGITEQVETTITKGGKKVRTMVPKYDLVTTHTGRRSGATNMFLAGIGTIDIMSFSGHKTLKSFMKYIRATQQETAERLKDHAYFK